MRRDEALAELARRRSLSSGIPEGMYPPLENGNPQDDMPDDAPLGPRDATWAEYARLKPLFGNGQDLPDNTRLTPLQSGLAAFSGAIDETGHGLQQRVANLLGLDTWAAKNDQAARQNRRVSQMAQEQNPGSAFAGGVLGGAASSLPFAAVGAIPGAGALPAWALRAAEGAAWGESQYRTPDESRALNVGVPAAAGAIMPPVLGAAGKTAKDIFKRATGKPKASIAKDILKQEGASKGYQEKLANTAKERVKAGKEVGVDLTPAEATGSPKTAQKQATVGRTPEGAGKLEEFYRGKGGRYAQENKAVDDFFKTLGVNPKNVSADTARAIRKTATDIIDEQKIAREKASKPIYKKAYKDSIPEKASKKLMQDEVIANAAQTVEKNPAYREAAKKIKPNSIEYWDLVKKRIDADIAAASGRGDAEMVRLLQMSKSKLIREADKYSPMYKSARGVYGSESEVLKELTDTNLGKISRLPDVKLKAVSSLLFDPKEIDPKTLNTIRGNLLKNNKQVYYDALAQNMKEKMDTVARSATKRELPAFYKSILAQDKTYNMYKDALKQNPSALRRLEAMKKAFPDLGGDFTPKTAAGLEKTGMTNSRDLMKGLYLKLAKGGLYDATAVEFITNPKWAEQADKILAQPEGIKKTAALVQLLTKISQSEGVKAFQTKEESME